MIRVLLPYHLRKLARVEGELEIALEGAATFGAVLAAVEARHPELRGTIRDRQTLKRRPFIRFFACQQDFSDAVGDDLLPESVANGREPLLIVGAMAGG